MDAGPDVAWLASYALGLASAGRSDAAAIADLADQAPDVDACCRAIDRLARCTSASTADRRHAMELLSRAAALPHAEGPCVDDDLTGFGETDVEWIDVSDGASDVGLGAVPEVDLQRLT